jgi:hypothetical protein
MDGCTPGLDLTVTSTGKKKKKQRAPPAPKMKTAIVKAKKPTVKPSLGCRALAGARVSLPLAWFVVPLRRAMAAPVRPPTARSRRRQCKISMAVPKELV